MCNEVIGWGTYTFNFPSNGPVSHIEHRISKKRSDKPSNSQHSECAESGHNKRIQAEASCQRAVVSLVDKYPEASVGTSDRTEAGRDNADFSARSTQRKEVVPGQLCLRIWGCGASDSCCCVRCRRSMSDCIADRRDVLRRGERAFGALDFCRSRACGEWSCGSGAWSGDSGLEAYCECP